jgi:ActR/RegA family two-component response regulator
MISAASGHTPTGAEALKIGACEVIGKPFDTDEIESLVEDVRTGLQAGVSTLD